MTSKHVGLWLLVIVAIYVWGAWGVFCWRNPTANEMSFFRDFSHVVTLSKLEKYQVDE